MSSRLHPFRTTRAHYDERQLGSLVLMVAMTNFFNRINTTFRVPAGTRWD